MRGNDKCYPEKGSKEWVKLFQTGLEELKVERHGGLGLEKIDPCWSSELSKILVVIT